MKKTTWKCAIVALSVFAMVPVVLEATHARKKKMH